MLTGFDSKWINTLYLDKVLHYENIIQTFSRTNRLFCPDKPLGLFVEHLDENLRKLNASFEDISALFSRAGVQDFTKIPDD